MWIFLRSLLLGLALVKEISPECKELYKANDPRPCCYIPSLFGKEHFSANCTTKCESKPDDVYCPLDCLIEVSEILEGGEVNYDKLKELRDAMDERHGGSMLQWNPVIKSSQKECVKILEAMGPTSPMSTSQSAELTPFMICLQQKLFLNCPTFSASEKCDAVKTFVESQEKCGFNMGDIYYLDGLFWRYLEPLWKK